MPAHKKKLNVHARTYVCLGVRQDARAHKFDLTVLSAVMRITKHTTHTNEINRTLNYHVDPVAICMYLRQREISDILNFTPLPMLSCYAC